MEGGKLMADLDRAFLRKLADWAPDEFPVTSVYLSVDGRLYPRKQDYELRLDDLLRRVRSSAGESGDRRIRRSVEEDARLVASFVREEFERGRTRGLALFSSHGAGLWESVELSRPVRNHAVVAPHPELRPLEHILEVYESFCSVLVDGSRARLFLAELGRIEERSDLEDEVPGRHDQGGWAQARYQRHIDEHRNKHLKRTAEVLFRFHKRRPFDHLILGGPEEVVAEFERELHDYLRRKVRARVSLPVTAGADEVLERSLALEEELERDRERDLVERIRAEAGAGRLAVGGLAATLDALNAGRVEVVAVGFDLSAPGHECPSCGWLSEAGGACAACGTPLRPVPDVVEAAGPRAVRLGARVETVTHDGQLEDMGGIGALLRF
jgi:peptide chain release factor subunit 1